MAKVKILLAGVGGYGNIYVSLLAKGFGENEGAVLAGIADPFAETAPGYEWLRKQGVPFFNTPAEFFREHQADLTVISTPTPLHSPYSIAAMENGSHVLCEKPLTPTVQELDALEERRRQLGKQLGAGFQWSFCETMTHLKRDILSGVYGKPRMMKTFISWPRGLSYYQTSTWKGRVRDGKGGYILDSIVTNAAAHYLHNIFFLLGGTMGSAAYPESMSAELYRAKDIESFDTCILRGKVGEGEFFYVASHATDLNCDPYFCYEFEKGTVTFNQDGEKGIVTGHLNDGRTVTYGDPFTDEEVFCKLRDMIRCARDGETPQCSIETVRPHLLACNALFDFGRVINFPVEMLEKVNMDDPANANICCRGLYQDLRACYEEAAFPSERGYSWSKPAVSIPLSGYQFFKGGAF